MNILTFVLAISLTIVAIVVTTDVLLRHLQDRRVQKSMEATRAREKAFWAPALAHMKNISEASKRPTGTRRRKSRS